jgi:hypothetical protein
MTAPATDRRPGGGTKTEVAERYLLLADISGYTAFLSSVETTHGIDFGPGVPAGFEVIGALLDAVVRGVEPTFSVAKLEGDAVFATAPATTLDGHGADVLSLLRGVHASFRAVQDEAMKSSDHVCTACPVAGTLRLKILLHRGVAVRVQPGAHAELHGPAVIAVHRLLKNTVETRLGPRPYILVTAAAAAGLGLETAGVEHGEEYSDVGPITARLIDAS